MDNVLAGRVAIVTGGAGGIGSRIARAYTAAGARVVIASRSQDKLDRLAAELSASGPGSLAVATDEMLMILPPPRSIMTLAAA